jgi:hypothetical protein
MMEVDSVLPADPAAPSCAGYESYRARSGRAGCRAAGLADFAERAADAVGDALAAVDLAFPAAFFGIVRELPPAQGILPELAIPPP